MLRTITLPLLAPAIATAAVLVFVLSMGAFAVPQLVGAPAGFGTITTRIYADLALGSDPQGFVEAITLALLLVVVTLIVVTPAESLARWTSAAWPDGSPRHRLAAQRPYHAVIVTIAMALYLLITSGLLSSHCWVLPSPGDWGAVNAGQLDPRQLPRCPDAADRSGPRRSLLLALAAASILLVLGTIAAALGRTRGGRSVSILITLTLVLPGSTWQSAC